MSHLVVHVFSGLFYAQNAFATEAPLPTPLGGGLKCSPDPLASMEWLAALPREPLTSRPRPLASTFGPSGLNPCAVLNSYLKSPVFSYTLIHCMRKKRKWHYVRIFSDDKCHKFVNDSRYREGLDGDCYVPFPRANTAGSVMSWYQARRTCWHFGGDLAPSRAVLNLTSSTWPGNGQFSVGLLRDEYVWHDTQGIDICYSAARDGSSRRACILLRGFFFWRIAALYVKLSHMIESVGTQTM